MNPQDTTRDRPARPGKRPAPRAVVEPPRSPRPEPHAPRPGEQVQATLFEDLFKRTP